MDIFIYITEIIGTVAFAVSGAMVSVKKHMDVFGVVFLGVTTAIGGGIIRDTVLGKLPPAVFSEPIYLYISLLVSLLVFVVAYMHRDRYFENEEKIDKINNIFDALGLGIFAVVGTSAAQNCGAGTLLCLFAGLSTAVGGGIVRDTLLSEIPFVLNKRIYAVAAVLGSGIFLFLTNHGVGTAISTLAGVTAVFLLRVLATAFRWHLPRIK